MSRVICVRQERECPELADPDHGQVSYTGRHFQVRGAGDLKKQDGWIYVRGC